MKTLKHLQYFGEKRMRKMGGSLFFIIKINNKTHKMLVLSILAVKR